MDNIQNQNFPPNTINKITDGHSKKNGQQAAHSEDKPAPQENAPYVPIDSNKLFEMISQKAVYNKSLVKTSKKSLEQSVAESIEKFPSMADFDDDFNLIYSETHNMFGDFISEAAVETVAQDVYLAKLGN